VALIVAYAAKKTSIKGLYKRVLIKPFYIKRAAIENAAVLYIKNKGKERNCLSSSI
jgi:phage pi2 protein 07